jgi:RsiW-degrading membrane proteinase PrsW (M82 family)
MNLLESLPTVIGIAAVAPALLALWLVIAADERPRSPALVWAAFGLGVASISTLGYARALFSGISGLTDNPVLALVLHALFGVAAPEETVKIAVILLVASRQSRAADPLDAVVYGAAAGLGFAAYENLVYLLQYPEMWRSLAVLRSVLTVPFHGALGIIAGAYIGIARAGDALGAHRRDRRAYLRNSALIVLAPWTLHAAFDLPLLVLQQHPEFTGWLRRALEGAGMVVGFGTIALAARLVRRIGIHHMPLTGRPSGRLRQLRATWALLIVGGLAGFGGTAFLLSSLRHWLSEPDRNVTMLLVPLGVASIAAGLVLLALAALAYVLGRNWLRIAGPAR